VSDRALSFKRGRFGNPQTALWWYEWRRRGLVLPELATIVALPIGFIVVIMPVLALTNRTGLSSINLLAQQAITISRTSPLALAFLIGALASFVTGAYYMLLDLRDSTSGFQGAGFRTPLTGQLLCRTRFLVSLASALTTVGLLVLVIAALDIIAWSAGAPRDRWLGMADVMNFQYPALAAILMLASYAVFCWALTFLPLLVALAAVSLACMASLGFSSTDAYSVYSCGLALCTVVVCAYFGKRAWSLRLFGRPGLTVCAALTALSACSAPLWLAALDLYRYRSTFFWLWVTLSIAPATAFVFQLLWVKFLRSR